MLFMRTPLRIATLFSCFILSLIALPTIHAQEFGPPSPDELSITSVPEQPGAPAVILFHDEICDDNLHYCSVYKRIKILTEAGIQKYSDISLYSYRGFAVADVRARTVHVDGKIVNFEGKPFDKIVYKGHGVRLNVKSFSVPDVQVGSIIEYRYFYHYPDEYFMNPPRWVLQEELFQKRVHFTYVPSSIVYSTSSRSLVNEHGTIVGVTWTGRLPNGVAPKVIELPKTQVELETQNVPAFLEEDHTVPSDVLKWHLQIYYRTNESLEGWWKDEGKIWNKSVEKFVGKTDGLADVISKVTSPSDTPEQKVKKLYAFVKTLDNYTYLPEKSALEQKALGLQQNRGAADVIRQKGGYRDEITRLFIALVRTAGFPAYAMRVSDRSEQIFEKAYLSTAQFDAELAIVTLDGKDVFLDPGTRYAPYGLLDWRYTASGGIRQAAKGTGFAESPLPSYVQALTKRAVRVALKEDGSADGTMAVLFAGQEALIRREDASKTDDEGRKKLLEDEARDWLPGGAQVTLTKAPQWDAIESPLIAEFKVSTPLAVSAGHRWTIPVDLLEVNETPMFPHAERVNHIYLNYPYRRIDDVGITVPATMQVETLPQSEEVKLSYALCATQRSQKGQQILAQRDFVIADMIIPVSEYKQLKDFYDKIKSVDEEQAILRGNASAKIN
jgi:transglutaminase-like putative cysteine protease